MARYGGEEFILVLPETDLTGATTAAERFRKNVREMVTRAGEKDIRITASFGIAALDPEGDSSLLTTDDLIRAADQCLYQAKDRGRNTCIGTAL